MMRVDLQGLCLLIFLMFPHMVWGNAWVDIPAGEFYMGSSVQERQKAYQISAQGYGHDGVRKAGWFAHEMPRKRQYLGHYRIQKFPVTQQEYALFVQQTHGHIPFVDKETWSSYGLVHPYWRVQTYLWHGEHPALHNLQHPVVLVNFYDAQAYAQWLSQKMGKRLRLPTEAEWEKAMRGVQGNMYPWGNAYDVSKLNNADKGSFATMPVGSFSQGSSPFGVLDGAGQVYEWTSTAKGEAYHIVKGGSWDDHGGVCRPAARHSRPNQLKHIIIGFRLVEDISDDGASH